MLTPDSTSPAAPVAAPATKRRRGLFDANQLKSLAKSEAVAATAARPEFAALLADEEISAAMVTALAHKVAQARQKISPALSEDDLSSAALRAETNARRALVTQWQELQSRALQKFGATQGAVPAAYGIGTPLLKVGALTLIQLGDALQPRLPSDVLPGATPAKLAAFGAAFTAWKTAATTQETHSSHAATARLEASALITAAETERRPIQFTADRLFPYGIKTNKETRLAFQIPATRPFRASSAGD